MLKEMQQVLRLLMLMGRRTPRQRAVNPRGGLLVLLWTDTKTNVQTVNCTVAAAGPWCTGITMKVLQSVLSDLKDSSFPWMFPSPQPELEELCDFTYLYGSLRLLLTFQVKDTKRLSPEWKTHLEDFLRTFSLANAGIRIHLKYKFSQQNLQPEFRVTINCRLNLTGDTPVHLDVTCKTQPPEYVKKGCWCQGGHPVLGDRVPLSIPPQTMDLGLCGELSMEPVTLLSPCALQYPNMETQLTRIQISFAGHSSFFQNLPAHLDCEELSLHCFSCKDLVLSGGTVFKGGKENRETEARFPTMHQSLVLFLFLQHSDPFTSELSDGMDVEALIEHHLEDILSNNRQAVTTVLQTGLKNALKDQQRRKKHQEKLRSAAAVILSSSISIVSCSSNREFRNACLNSMKVRDTHELSVCLADALRRVMSWKFTPRGRCYSGQVEDEMMN